MNNHSFRTGWSFPKYTIWWFRILGWLRLNFTLCRIHVIRIWSDRWRDKFNNDLYIRRLSFLISFNMHFVFGLKKINYYRSFTFSVKSKELRLRKDILFKTLPTFPGSGGKYLKEYFLIWSIFFSGSLHCNNCWMLRFFLLGSPMWLNLIGVYMSVDAIW